MPSRTLAGRSRKRFLSFSSKINFATAFSIEPLSSSFSTSRILSALNKLNYNIIILKINKINKISKLI